jgi:single-stranded DNA-binding protein
MYGERAKKLSELLKKGNKVHVQGRLHTDVWTDKNKQLRQRVEVIANSIIKG